MDEDRILVRLNVAIALLLVIVGNLYSDFVLLVLRGVGAVIPSIPPPVLGLLVPAVVLGMLRLLARLSIALESV